MATSLLEESQPPIEIPAPPGAAKPFRLRLRRFRRSKDPTHKPVLLLHGANNSSDAFLHPNGGLTAFLCDRGYDVWLLDWRASRWVLRQPPLSNQTFAPAEVERSVFKLENVVTEDLPRALARIREQTEKPLGLVGFCVGAAAVSIATARGVLEPFDVDSLVLMTVALFLRGPWDTWMKSREYILEQCIAEVPELRAIDPHAPDSWPPPLEQAYRRWPDKLRPAGAEPWFQRLAFMYGEPYSRRLVDGGLSNPAEFFGPLHIGFYLEAARMLRHGHLPGVEPPEGQDPLEASVQRHFAKRTVTLIGGAQDRLWHRESLDLMYDWLLRAGGNSTRRWCTKHILSQYAHNDLLWAKTSPEDVFDKITRGLPTRPRAQNQAAE